MSSPQLVEGVPKGEKPSTMKTAMTCVGARCFQQMGSTMVEENQKDHTAFHKVCRWARRDLVATTATQKKTFPAAGTLEEYFYLRGF